MQLHNTFTGRKEPFTPLDPERVTLYLCGPTVYSYAHIGNARPPVVFDVLARVLRRRYPRVLFARNITDIDDKINKAARDEAVAISVVTARATKAYHEDLAALGVAPPDFEPRVTEHLPTIISMIDRLVASGHAYEVPSTNAGDKNSSSMTPAAAQNQSHVLFHVPSYAGYGQLSKRDRKELVAGARVEVAPYKKDPGDFVLWKPSTPDLPGWESPWGRGRPGWHIECSAMAEKILGETIDIHGGGHDLIFPHHENERAQSTCAHGGKVFARYWLHNGFLTMHSEKMAKSVGNVLLVRDILKQAPGEAVRLALLSGHYRQPLDWNDAVVPEASKKLDRLYGTLRDLAAIPADTSAGPPAAFIDFLEDDLNTPAALAVLFEVSHAAHKAVADKDKARLKGELLAAGGLMGLLQQRPEQWFSWAPAGAAVDAGEIERLLAQRAEARKAKNFQESDRIRDDLAARGVLIEDSASGTRWRFAQ